MFGEAWRSEPRLQRYEIWNSDTVIFSDKTKPAWNNEGLDLLLWHRQISQRFTQITVESSFLVKVIYGWGKSNVDLSTTQISFVATCPTRLDNRIRIRSYKRLDHLVKTLEYSNDFDPNGCLTVFADRTKNLDLLMNNNISKETKIFLGEKMITILEIKDPQACKRSFCRP